MNHKRSMLTAAWLVGVALCAAGCSTSQRDPSPRDKAVPFQRDLGSHDLDSTESLNRDLPPPNEAGDRALHDKAKPDMAIVVLRDKGVPDKAIPDKPKPDGAPTGCDPSCIAANPKTCVKDSSGDCVECLTTADCQQNPGAWGPVCITTLNYCTCGSDAECATNAWGHSCDPTGKFCFCMTDAECSGSIFGKKCDVASQLCGCVTNSDCKAGTCNAAMGICK